MNRVRLHWELSPIDERSMRRSQEILGREVGRAGLGRVRSALEDEKGLWTKPEGAYHHIGTTRMHEDPKQGVVDAKGRVHGISNLYIAGSSVFPTAGYANPTLTIVALAVRLADHVKRLLR
jgi:choline dehydrogenase-like flavoprotein